MEWGQKKLIEFGGSKWINANNILKRIKLYR